MAKNKNCTTIFSNGDIVANGIILKDSSMQTTNVLKNSTRESIFVKNIAGIFKNNKQIIRCI